VLEAIDPRHVALWGQHTVNLRHTLADQEMFSDESIAGLIDTVDPSHLKIETMPDDGYDVRAWSSCDRTGLTGMQVLEAVRNGRISIELKALEDLADHHRGAGSTVAAASPAARRSRRIHRRRGERSRTCGPRGRRRARTPA